MKKKLLIDISVAVSTIMVFFGAYIVNNLYILQIASCIIALLYFVLSKTKIVLNKASLLWGLFVIAMIISTLLSADKSYSFKVLLSLITTYIIKVCYENSKEKWYDSFITYILIYSSIHLICTLLQLISPTLIAIINSHILSPNALRMNQLFLKNGTYAGITFQTGLNAFYISLFTIIIFSRIICRKGSKIYNISLLILGILGILLTGKRGLLLFTIISIILGVIIINKRNKKKNIKYAIILLIAFALISLVVSNMPQFQVAFNKNVTLENAGDISNGRTILWQDTEEIFRKNPIFGIGIGVVPSYIGEGSHNVYLQLLAETGLIGFSLFIIVIGYTLMITIKKMQKTGIENIMNNYQLLVSLCIQLLFIFYCFTGNPLYDLLMLTPYAISTAIIINSKKKETK